MPIFNFFFGEVRFYSMILVSTSYIKIGSHNSIKKKKSAFWIIIPQIDPNLMRDFSYSCFVLRTLRNIHLFYYMFDKEFVPN